MVQPAQDGHGQRLTDGLHRGPRLYLPAQKKLKHPTLSLGIIHPLVVRFMPCKGLKRLHNCNLTLRLLGNQAAQTPPEWSHSSPAEAGH